jgi:hypothetical protein
VLLLMKHLVLQNKMKTIQKKTQKLKNSKTHETKY